MSKILNIKLHIITPIHIGTDDVYEPFSFVIDEKKRVLIEFDQLKLMDFLQSDDIQRLASIAEKEDLLLIYKTLKNLYEKYKAKYHGDEVSVPEELIRRYLEILRMGYFNTEAKEAINKFQIHKTIYNPNDKNPYIPGSSIKGSIRTAYLSYLAEKLGIKNWTAKADELETRLLSRGTGREKMTTDPFRMLKVSDFMPQTQVRRSILYAVNRKKELSGGQSAAQRRGLYQLLETVMPGSVFSGTIKLDKPAREDIISSPIPEKFLKALNYFYSKIFEQEAKFIKHLGQPIDYYETVKKMLNENSYLIRIGKHSGAEAVTIEGNRRIKVRTRRGYEDRSSPTTIWLSAPSPRVNQGLKPFGWAVLEIIQ